MLELYLNVSAIKLIVSRNTFNMKNSFSFISHFDILFPLPLDIGSATFLIYTVIKWFLCFSFG